MIEQKNYITPAGYQKLITELNHLMRVERPEVTKLVQWAASNGDRSEDADYLYGKKRLREIDRRIRFLNMRAESAQVVDPLTIKSTRVQFGATVKVKDEEDEILTYTIVGVDEVDTAKGRISWQSPIGRGLIGKNEGDEVTIKVPSGELIYEILAITYCQIE